MNRKDIQQMEEKKITTIFNPSDYDSFHDAMETLEFIARNSSLDPAIRDTFNHNFYGFLTLVQKHFELDFDLLKDVAIGIGKLASLSPSEADEITLIGDDDKYSLKLLDTNGKYSSTFSPESGKCRFPSHWFSLYHVVMVNEL